LGLERTAPLALSDARPRAVLRSTSLPFLKTAPLRTRATRCGAFTDFVFVPKGTRHRLRNITREETHMVAFDIDMEVLPEEADFGSPPDAA